MNAPHPTHPGGTPSRAAPAGGPRPPIEAPAAAPVIIDLPTREGYDRWSSWYDDDPNPLVHLDARHLPGLLGDVRALDVADLGCGTGRHALRLAALGARVTALDFSEGMLARARAKPGAGAIRFIGHDLAQPLPLGAASFDRVLCCLALEHISPLEPFLREIARICRPGGFILASVIHPAMHLREVKARFTDPAGGEVIRPASFEYRLSDYVLAAGRAGLAIDDMREIACDQELAAASPRAGKYLGWPMLLLMRLRPGGAG